MATFEPETRKTPRGRPYRKAIGRATVKVDGPGYEVERCTIGARDPGTFADILHRRHRDINATFDEVVAIVQAAAHPAQAVLYIRKLEAVRALWHAKGTKWAEAFKAADHATRRMHFIPAGDKARLRPLLLNPEYGGKAWMLLPGTRKSRKAGIGFG